METYPSKPAKQATFGTFSGNHREQGKRFFVDYFVCQGTIGHEVFASFSGMRFFMRQLQKGAVLDYGQITDSTKTHGLISTEKSGLATSRSTH